MNQLFMPISYILLCACFWIREGAAPKAVEVRYEDGGFGWELVSIDVDLTLDSEQSKMTGSGKARLRLRASASRGPNLALVSGEMRFEEITPPAGAGAAINQTGDQGSIRFSQPREAGAEIEVGFRYRALRDPLPANSQRVFFSVQRIGAFAYSGYQWYPVPASQTPGGSGEAPGRTRLTVPAAWATASNGRLIESITQGNTRTEAWLTPNRIARGFVAGPYQVTHRKVGSTDLRVYLLERHADKGPPYIEGLAKVLETLQARMGPYPFEAAAMVEVDDKLFPTAESEQGYIVTASTLLDARADFNTAVFAHELSHSWWGDCVRISPPGVPRCVRLDPNHQLLLWEPAYGPRPTLGSVKR